ncbi:hypothetical protein OESDEN_00891 [Oesophagostomum dentatum]|uniref:Mos1 transposase HTH domain-containing protein n=1 Tax=Oesophagostomum dentatum TaxID=61180 RepID=A0A0B1TNP0_OESDE|nr:hypothetical protein OESDEN_00891 [Oesophagostomum dentatum]
MRFRRCINHLVYLIRNDHVARWTVNGWLYRFVSGDTSFEGNERPERASTVNDEELLRFIKANPEATTAEMTLGCCQRTNVTHLHYLGCRKVKARWVPHQLTTLIVKSESTPANRSSSGQIARSFSRVWGSVMRFGSSTTTMHDKPSGFLATQRCQRSRNGPPLAPGSSFRLDIGPSEPRLFQPLKLYLREEKFNKCDLKMAVDEFFASQPPEFWAKGINDLTARWANVIDMSGDYTVD